MKIAVMGTGSAGLCHLRAIRAIDGLDAVAVPVRSSRLKELEADGFATASGVSDAAARGASAAIIATDTSRHIKDALTALEEGLDVLVEKPLAIDCAEAHRLCVQASTLGGSVFVGSVLRFSESLNTFRDVLDKVGRLHSLRIVCQSFLPDWRPDRPYRDSYSARADEGGVLRDLTHEIDYAGWLFGWPLSVQARVRNLGRLGIASEEIAELTWETPDGCIVSVRLDYLTRPPRRRMTACGELGTVEWDGIAGTVTVMLGGVETEELRSSQGRDQMFAAQAYAFANATSGICDSQIATGEDGVKALAVCGATVLSSQSRREEPVEYP